MVFFGVLSVDVSTAAGTASFSLSPSSGSYNINTNFTVTVYENSGSDAVSAVEADLAYDQAKLQFVSTDTSTSAFDVSSVSSGGSGYVNFQRSKTGTLTGNQIVGKVTFKALLGSGTTSVTFAPSSAISTSGNTNIWDELTTGGTYTMTTPAPVSDSSPSVGTTSSSSPSAGSVAKSKPSSTTADSSSGAEAEKNNSSESVVANNDSTSTSYLVSVKIVNSKGKPQVGIDVALGSNYAKTDSTGVASFSGITPGSYKVNVQGGKIMGDSTIVVDGTKSTKQVQHFELKLKAVLGLPILLEVGGGIVLVIIIGYLLLHKTSFRQMLGKLSGKSSVPDKHPAPTSTVFSGSVIQPTVVSTEANVKESKLQSY